MSCQEEQLEKKMAALRLEMKQLRRRKRAALVKPFTIEKARQTRQRADALSKRQSALWDTLHRRCPHSYKTVKRYDQPDCDGMWGGWVHYRECTVCKHSENLPTDDL